MKQSPADIGGEFKPQPWHQCAKALRDSGHPNEAKSVLIAMQNQMRVAGKIPRLAKPFHWMYGTFIGYGYEPQRLGLIITGFWLAGALVYAIAASPNLQPGLFAEPVHLIEPTDGSPSFACASRNVGKPIAARATKNPDFQTFAPLVYSLDHIIPVIDLGHRKDWRPVVTDPECSTVWRGQFVRAVTWLQVGFGWIAAIMLGAAVGTLVKNE